MNPRNLAALASAAVLAGCGFTDSTNYAGGDFLESQGYSVLPRSQISLGAFTKSVEFLPPQGVSALPGINPLVIGVMGGDSVRAVLAYDLTDSTRFHGLAGLDALPFQYLSFSVSDTAWHPSVRLRLVWLTDTTQAPGLFVGMEPVETGKETVLSDSIVVLNHDSVGTFRLSLPGSAAAKIRAQLAKQPARSWLVAVLDPIVNQPASTDKKVVWFSSTPTLVRSPDSGALAVASWEGLQAFRSTQMRGASAPTASIGWWADGGRRARIVLDGQALRAKLHGILPVWDTTAGFDNSFHILQARAKFGFTRFDENGTDTRTVGVTSFVVEKEGDVKLDLASSQTLPSDIEVWGDHGYTVPPTFQCQDRDPVVDCQLIVEGVQNKIGTRLAFANINLYSYTQDHFWLRKDVADSVEFGLMGNLRVSLASDPKSPKSVKIHWILMRSSRNGDSQSDSVGVRNQALLAPGSTSLVQEIRSTLSDAITQSSRKVVIDVVPSGGSAYGLDLWDATPSSSVIDSIQVLVRPRDGKNF